MSGKHRILVAATFWDDHCERTPSDDGEQGLATEVKRLGARVLIEGDAKQINCLYQDAKYYTDPWGPDETPPAILQSARRVRAALEKEGFQ